MPGNKAFCLPPPAFARALHIAPRLGLVYVNNPKSACSTIKLSLQRAELGDPEFEPPKSVHDFDGSPLVTWPDTADLGEAAFEGRRVFSFVREPFGRLRSVYLNKIVRPQKRGKFRTDAGFAADETPSFDRFVRSICDQDPATQNPHWRLQVLNLSVDAIRYDAIGKLERFAGDWARFADTVPGLDRRSHFAGMRTGAAVRDDLVLSPGARRAVQTAYAADFARFDYDPDSSDAGSPGQ